MIAQKEVPEQDYKENETQPVEEVSILDGHAEPSKAEISIEQQLRRPADIAAIARCITERKNFRAVGLISLLDPRPNNDETKRLVRKALDANG
jgi:hypothetical protein